MAGHEEAGFFLRLARLAPPIDQADREHDRRTRQRELVDRRFLYVDFAERAAAM
jgi:hypothetical protein